MLLMGTIKILLIIIVPAGCLPLCLVVCPSGWLSVCPGWLSVLLAGYLSFWLIVQLSVHVSGFCPEDISWSHPIFYNQTWYGGGASLWGRVLCEKIGLLSYFVSVAVIEKKAGGGGGGVRAGGRKNGRWGGARYREEINLLKWWWWFSVLCESLELHGWLGRCDA